MANSFTTARCLGLVSTAFIAPEGGKPNFGAKALATLWYLLLLPDAQTRLHRQLHHKRMPWYAPSRILGATLAAANIVTMPLSWGLLVAGRRNASRLAAVGVLLNPPSLTLSLLLVTELSSAILKKSCGAIKGTSALIAKPFKKKEAAPATPAPAPSAPATTGAATPTPATTASAAPTPKTTAPTPTAKTTQPKA